MTHEAQMVMMQGKLVEELKSLRDMRELLREQLHLFHLTVAALDFDTLPDASFLLKILNQIHEIVEGPPKINQIPSLKRTKIRSPESVDLDVESKSKQSHLDSPTTMTTLSPFSSSSSSSSSADFLHLPPVGGAVTEIPSNSKNLPDINVLKRPSWWAEVSSQYRNGMTLAATPSETVTPDPEYQIIWQGVLEFTEIQKESSDVTHKVKRHLQCDVSMGEEPEVLDWFAGCSEKLSMQLIPKSIILDLGSTSFEGVKSINFHFSQGPTADSLMTLMTSGFVGCVHFVDQKTDQLGPTLPKIFLLLFSQQRKSFIGFIPKDQNDFRQKLKDVMGQAKTVVATRVSSDEEVERTNPTNPNS